MSLNTPNNDLSHDISLKFQICTSISLGMLKLSFSVYKRTLKSNLFKLSYQATLDLKNLLNYDSMLQ